MDKTVYILEDRKIRVEWTILKGTSPVREDFRRALVKVFLIGNCEKYLLEATADRGTLMIDIPEGLEPGLYSLEAIWVKNAGHPGRHDRDLCRSMKQDLFAITEFEEEATNLPEGTVVLKAKSSTATYGYDGLSSYELAVLRGEWTGTEGEWLKHQRYVSVLDGRGDSETDTMSQKSITEELEAHDEAIKANKKAIEENKKEFDEYTEKTDDRLDNVEERLDYIPKESFLSSDPAAGFNTDDVIEEDFVAERAISDRFGRRIDEEYLTREAAKNYTQEVVDGSKLEIMPGSVVPESLSPAVKQMIETGAGKPGSITNLPDEEDITVTDANTLQFKDKEYNPYNYSGMGRVYLRKHIVNGTNVLAQHMINKPNTIYIIQYDYCLADQTIEIPENCVLQFEGGSFRNGTIKGNNTKINYEVSYNIFNNCVIKNFYFPYIDIQWTGSKSGLNEERIGEDCSEYIKRSIYNIQLNHVGTPLIIRGEFYISKTIEIPFLNIIGTHEIKRNLLNVNEFKNIKITYKSPSTLSIKEGITAFYISGFKNEENTGFSYISINNILIESKNKNSVFIYHDASGSPSRPGLIKNVESFGFDKIFEFYVNKNYSLYFNLKIDSCYFYSNNYAIYSETYDDTRAGLGGLKITDSVLEQGARIYLNSVFSSITIDNCLLEGQSGEDELATIRIKSYTHSSIVINGCYFEQNKGDIILITGSNCQCSFTNNYIGEGCTGRINFLYNSITYLDIKNNTGIFRDVIFNLKLCILRSWDRYIVNGYFDGVKIIDPSITSEIRSSFLATETGVNYYNGMYYLPSVIVPTHEIEKLNYRLERDKKDLIFPNIDITKYFPRFIDELNDYMLCREVTSAGLYDNSTPCTIKQGDLVIVCIYTDVRTGFGVALDGGNIYNRIGCLAGFNILAFNAPMDSNIISLYDYTEDTHYTSIPMFIVVKQQYIASTNISEVAYFIRNYKAANGTVDQIPKIPRAGDIYRNGTAPRTLFYNGEEWENITPLVVTYGSSIVRPIAEARNYTGYQYYDTTLNKPIWWTGEKWVDATGAEV